MAQDNKQEKNATSVLELDESQWIGAIREAFAQGQYLEILSQINRMYEYSSPTTDLQREYPMIFDYLAAHINATNKLPICSTPNLGLQQALSLAVVSQRREPAHTIWISFINSWHVFVMRLTMEWLHAAFYMASCRAGIIQPSDTGQLIQDYKETQASYGAILQSLAGLRDVYQCAEIYSDSYEFCYQWRNQTAAKYRMLYFQRVRQPSMADASFIGDSYIQSNILDDLTDSMLFLREAHFNGFLLARFAIENYPRPIAGRSTDLVRIALRRFVEGTLINLAIDIAHMSWDSWIEAVQSKLSYSYFLEVAICAGNAFSTTDSIPHSTQQLPC